MWKAVKNYARGGTIDTKPLKDKMKQPEQREKIVNDGFTEESQIVKINSMTCLSWQGQYLMKMQP